MANPVKAQHNRHNRRSRLLKYEGFGDNVLLIFIYFILLMVLLAILLPMINIVSSSFSSPKAVMAGKVSLLPVEFTLVGYEAVLSNKLIVSGFRNSFIYTIFGTIMNLSMTLFAAYPLSRDGFFGNKFFVILFTITMFFSGGMVPSYLLMKNLRLINSPLAMIIPSGVAVYNMIIARTYMRTSIPLDIYGAAEIDGCSDSGIFFRIVIPLSKPLVAVLVLMFAVGHWNSYFGGLMYLRDENLFPLQLVLRKILILNQIDITKMDVTRIKHLWEKQYYAELIKYSSIVVSTVPMLMIYPFIQKYFVKGIMLGSLKE
ncbi:MAG: carbohydrate ABC transporter permease [Clostridiaceae bacterium]|nr:carbohydrate ABC transporter permease [Clostridiaceae bacterium]